MTGFLKDWWSFALLSRFEGYGSLVIQQMLETAVEAGGRLCSPLRYWIDGKEALVTAVDQPTLLTLATGAQRFTVELGFSEMPPRLPMQFTFARDATAYALYGRETVSVVVDRELLEPDHVCRTNYTVVERIVRSLVERLHPELEVSWSNDLFDFTGLTELFPLTAKPCLPRALGWQQYFSSGYLDQVNGGPLMRLEGAIVTKWPLGVEVKFYALPCEASIREMRRINTAWRLQSG